MTATISSNEGASAGQSLPRAVAAAELAGRRRRQPGRVHVDRDPVNAGARVEGCIRETDDDMLIIDSTPSWFPLRLLVRPARVAARGEPCGGL
jgi:hypothetical protein